MSETNRTQSAVLGLIGLVATGWAYWSVLVDTAERWTDDPQYSHGWLVPIFAAYLLYHRRAMIPAAGFRPRWWGVGILALAVLARAVAVALYQPWLDIGSLLVALFGLAATVGSRAAVRWAWPAVLFLGFMIPLPYGLQSALGSSLQKVATMTATYLLQTVGVPAIAEGNVIVLTTTRVGVVEACNGLSMLVTFFALAVGFALLLRRHWLYAVILVAAAAPIAVAANVIRISVTGILYEANQDKIAKVVFHDVAGWLMMPLGVAMLAALLWFIDRTIRVRPAGR